MLKSGSLSIHTENIFPIIKKFLYFNNEVFLRELVSNAVDATQKLKTLASVGEFKGEIGDTKISIKIDKEAKTLTISDKGIGLTAEEVERYINQIAFSSAEEFLEKYKDDAHKIIGHFGLGFYSAFMVADKVELKTRSWKPDSEPVLWTCEGTTAFSMMSTEKESRGTDVILYLNSESEEFLQNYRINEILKKYCKFLPIDIEFDGRTINNTTPAWTKAPSSLTDEDYRNFYKELYPFSEPPLFWIHLNVDYPFTLTGILYFPKLKPEMDLQKNKIQLYANQVFITDSVEEIVPDYLTLMHGVIDSPDIPLNVSRSYLQADSNVKKISNHIAKKVADKLHELFFDSRQEFERKWENIGVFVKYGMIRDFNFFERAKKFCLLQDTEGKFYTLDELKTEVQPNQTDKHGDTIYLYTTDQQAQHHYIYKAKAKGYKVLLLNSVIDSHFIQYIEGHLEKTRLCRVDADTIDALIDKGLERASLLNQEEQDALVSLTKQVINSESVAVKCEALGEQDAPMVIVRSEYQRRIKDMSKLGMLGQTEIADPYTIVVNTNHPFARRALIAPEQSKEQVKQAYQLALLAQGMLTGEALTEFINRNNKALN